MSSSMTPRGEDPERDALVDEFEAEMKQLYVAARKAGRSVETFLHQQMYRIASTETLRRVIPEVRRFAERWEQEAAAERDS